MEATIKANPVRHSTSIPSALAAKLEAAKNFPCVLEHPLDADPFRWLAAQRDGTKLVWGGRGTDDLMVGAGCAARVRAERNEPTADLIRRCRGLLTALPRQRFFGGFAFQRNKCLEGAWSEFGSASFWLPRMTLEAGRLQLIVLSEADRSAATEFIGRLAEPTSVPAMQLPVWQSRTDLPNRTEWDECIGAAMRLFAGEVLEKIVLARRVDLNFAENVSAVALVDRLTRATPACYHFCFQTSPEVAFVGATPERLFWRSGRELRSEAIAGTRPRGLTADEDRRLANELLGSDKDQLEHDIVRKSIRQRLHQLVEQIDVDLKASVLQLANKQHLVSRVLGRLAAVADDGRLVDQLHPTPAVGGYPTENALAEISRLEPFDRGWYAAPVGWIGRDEMEFAVAIRSGLIHENQLSLYSGAGIVPASTAQQEWEEVEHKISDFLQLLDPDEVTTASLPSQG